MTRTVYLYLQGMFTTHNGSDKDWAICDIETEEELAYCDEEEEAIEICKREGWKLMDE